VYATLADVQERTLPVALAEYHPRESELVTGLLVGVAANERAVVGRAATFTSLMQGEVETLGVARDLDGGIWQCTQCESVRAIAVGTCPGCGARLTPRRSGRWSLAWHGGMEPSSRFSCRQCPPNLRVASVPSCATESGERWPCPEQDIWR
jgi:hypothetical protein